MRLTCQYSKISFNTAAFLGTGINTPVTCVHPIFYADFEYLTACYKAWEDGKVHEKRDQRLLFLALLNSSGHVDWYHSADPKADTVAANMELLFRTASWVNDIMLPSLKLPRFAINESTSKLANIKDWLGAWNEVRDDFDRGYLSRSEQEQKARKQAALDLLTDRKNKDDTSKQRHAAYLRTLADWADIALQFPRALSSYWKQIIRCQSAVAALDFSSRIVDIEELVEHIEEFGEYDSVHYYALLAQVRQVLSDAKGESISALDFAALLREPSLPERSYTKEAGSSTEAMEVARQVAQAPLTQPKPDQFTSRVQYNLALARWTLAQQQKAGV